MIISLLYLLSQASFKKIQNFKALFHKDAVSKMQITRPFPQTFSFTRSELVPGNVF